MGRVKPSIWFFINHLKDVDAVNERSALNAERGVPPPSQRRKWRLLEQRIARVKDDYVTGRRDLVQYWSAMKHVVHRFV